MTKIPSRLFRSLLLSSALLISAPSFALQIVDAFEGKTLFAKISANEPSRLSIDGGKIRRLKVDPNELTVEGDPENGQAFIYPKAADKPVTVFVISDNGRTYTLVLQPVDAPTETVILRDVNRHVVDGPKIEKAGSYEKVIRSFIVGMASGHQPDGLDFEPMQREFTLWENSRLIQTAQYSGRNFIGEKYTLYNTGKSVLRVAEQEFYRKGVIAVAVDVLTLDPGMSTQIYIVRNAGK